MPSIRLGRCLAIAGPVAAHTPPAQPPEQKPLNPTPEIAREQAEGPSSAAGRIGSALIRVFASHRDLRALLSEKQYSQKETGG